MRHPNETLSEQIEHLVREHIEATRRVAAAAVERAFSSASTLPRPKVDRVTPRARGHRRASAELVALSERLYEAVCAQPGEPMSVLGPGLGKSPRELQRPMQALKRTGRVRSIGQRHQTRYFPALVRAAGGDG